MFLLQPPHASGAPTGRDSSFLFHQTRFLEGSQVVIERVGALAESPGEFRHRERRRVLEQDDEILANGGSQRFDHAWMRGKGPASLESNLSLIECRGKHSKRWKDPRTIVRT